MALSDFGSDNVTGSMINPLVCNVPRVVATSLNELFVCNDPREFANKQLVQGRCILPS